MKLGIDYFLLRLGPWLALKVDSVDAVRAGGLFVELMSWNGSVGLSLEEEIQGFFFIFTDIQGESLDMDLPLGIILDANGGAWLLGGGHIRNEVEHELIVDFKVGDTDGVLVVESAPDLLENMSDGSWDETSILVVLHAPTHGKGLSSTSLSVDHDRAVETINNWFYYVSRTGIEYVLLGRVMKKFIEFEAPGLLLVIYETTTLILWDIHVYVLYEVTFRDRSSR